MILKALSSFFAGDHAALLTHANTYSVWQQDVRDAAAAYERDITLDEAIGAIQRGTRILRIFGAGLEHSNAFKEAVQSATLPCWVDFTTPPADEALQEALVDKLYIARKKDDIPLLELGDQARFIGARLFERCVADKHDFDVAIYDENFMALLIDQCDEAGLASLAQSFVERRGRINTRIIAIQNLPVWDVIEANKDKNNRYKALIRPYRERVLGGQMPSVLTCIPTTRDALIDGIAYPKYIELYFRMCDQPWDAIKEAQYKLIERLNAAKMLRFTNSDGTDLSMNIDGFTFCNSVIARNIPGAEVFSAPHIDSAQGVIVAKGLFTPRDEAGHIIRDLRLGFDKGLLVEAKAAEGQDVLDRTLAIDDGTRRIGEIGIGTNPYLKRHVASILFAEKIGGSFHVALGDAYTMDHYMGDEVRVDNGSRSALHWDITTMLYGKEGKIFADGAPIMRDGFWLDNALDVLNRGWAALPYEARPPVWQAIYNDKIS